MVIWVQVIDIQKIKADLISDKFLYLAQEIQQSIMKVILSILPKTNKFVFTSTMNSSIVFKELSDLYVPAI